MNNKKDGLKINLYLNQIQVNNYKLENFPFFPLLKIKENIKIEFLKGIINKKNLIKINKKAECIKDQRNLKYILIGSYGMFEFLKSRYYIKEIEEALLKDEEINKNKDNLKFCFNLKNVVKKLVKDSIEVHKKITKYESFIERCLTLITLSQNNTIQ